MDKDTEMLQQMSAALTALQVRFKESSIEDRAAIRPSLQEAMDDLAAYEARLLKDGVITTDKDLADMRDIQAAIDKAGDKQALLLAIARTVAFVATKI